RRLSGSAARSLSLANRIASNSPLGPHSARHAAWLSGAIVVGVRRLGLGLSCATPSTNAREARRAARRKTDLCSVLPSRCVGVSLEAAAPLAIGRRGGFSFD